MTAYDGRLEQPHDVTVGHGDHHLADRRATPGLDVLLGQLAALAGLSRDTEPRQFAVDGAFGFPQRLDAHAPTIGEIAVRSQADGFAFATTGGLV
jgi:hypothetical protein